MNFKIVFIIIFLLIPIKANAFNIYIADKLLKDFTIKDSLTLVLGGLASWSVHEISHQLEGDTNSIRNGRAGWLGATLVNLGLYITPAKKTTFHFGFSVMSTLDPLIYEPHTYDLSLIEDNGGNWKVNKYGFAGINALLTAPMIRITW